jgi:hypothetical protein
MRAARTAFTGVLITAALLSARVASAQQLTTERKLFPKDWASGYIDLAVAPRHNEPDLNRCAASTGADGGTQAPCAAFARYVGSGHLELRPVAFGPARRVFMFVEPNAYMGRNLPRVLYTDSVAPIAFERSGGIGVNVSRNLELRLTNHRVDWLGKYQRNLGVADLGKNGPLSVYTTVSARWYFGGYGRRAWAY